MCVLLCVFTACVLGEGVEMFSWLDGHSFILLQYFVCTPSDCTHPQFVPPGLRPSESAMKRELKVTK